jgi:RNA polymerase sigma-70 factor (ECF subfamily)
MLEVLNTNLIKRAEQGDPAVVIDLYERYQQAIFRYLYYRVGDQQTAEDLTSEVFLRMIEAMSNYKNQKISFQAWLFQVARNLSIDHYRKVSAHKDVQLCENLTEGGEEPLDLIEQELTHETLRQALEKLPFHHRDVVVMRFIAGMPIGEVAQALHKSEDAVKGLQRRALLALRDILDEWEVTYV